MEKSGGNYNKIENTYNVGMVNSNNSIGGDIIGYIETDKIDILSSFALLSNNDVIGKIGSIGNKDESNLNAEKKTLEEMKLKSTYVGFDFENIWEYKDGEFPILKAQPNVEEKAMYVKNEPRKKQYVKDSEELELEGLEVYMIYTDNTEEKVDLEKCEITGFDNSKVGEQTITVKYKKYTTDFKITIIEKQIIGLYSVANKLEDYNGVDFMEQYTEGDYISLDNRKTYLNYNNGEDQLVDNSKCSISKNGPLEVTDESFIVTYTDNGKTYETEVGIKVYPKIDKSKIQGNGTEEEPFLISNEEQLEMIKENPLMCYKLTQDIDMKEKEWQSIAGFNNPFEGSLDGSNHKIVNLYLKSNNKYDNANFIEAMFNADVKNLTIENAEFSGYDVSGVVGMLVNSKIEDVIVKDSNIESLNNAAGICCELLENSKVERCGFVESSINITDTNEYSSTGGIVAIANGGNIKDCYNTSQIKSANVLGGICGRIYGNVNIGNTYNTGKMSEGNYSGGIYGYQEEGSIVNINNCYDIKDSVQTIGNKDKGEANVSNVVEKSLAELKNKATFNGFDFEKVWEIKENEETPTLKRKSNEVDLGEFDIIEKDGRKYIKNIALDTTVNKIEEKLQHKIEVYNINNKKLKDTDNVGTGSKIIIKNDNDEIIDNYYIIIKGDIDGNGQIDLYDILNLIELVFDKDSNYKWNESVRLAGKCADGDINAIPNIYDILRLIEYHFDDKKW